MKFLKKINNVSSVKALNDNVYYCKENALFDSTGNYVLNNVECQSFWFDKFNIFYHTNDGEFRLFNLKNKKNGIIDFAPNLNNEEVVFVTYDHNFCLSDLKSYYKNAKYNLKSNSYIQKYENIDNERVIYSNDKVVITFTTDINIHAYTLPAAQPLWQFDLGVLGTYQDSNGETQAYEVRQFVGVYESVLWVFLKGNEMLGFDLHNGSVKQHLKGVKNENVTGNTYRFLDPESHHIFYETDYILDTENGKIIGLIADRFYEIDLKANVIEPKLYGLWKKMETIGIDKNNVHRQTVLQGNELYFLCINQHKFGIFDIVTKEITYQSEKIEVAEKSGTCMLLKNLQVSNDKVYILDSANTLHIFQKENPSI